MARQRRGQDPVARLQEEARWSSYTASWSRRVTGGPPWVRRFLIAVILLIFISAVIGAVVTISRGDPIERTYGEAGHQLELAMAQLGGLGIACSTDIVADAGRGGASVGCTTQEGVRVALVSFRDVATRDQVVNECWFAGLPVVVPRSASWVLWPYDESDLAVVRARLQRGEIPLRPEPACEGSVDLLDPPTPSGG